MKTSTRSLLDIIFFFIGTLSYAQKGTVSGVLKDTDGPLPGISILIKGTTKGTDTNFDGEYSIICKVGDVLVFQYLGYQDREVIVTASMFDPGSKNQVEFIAIKPILSDAYTKALKSLRPQPKEVPSLNSAIRTYNDAKWHGALNYIKNMRIDSNFVFIEYLKPDVHFEVGYISNFGSRFVKEENIPALQNTFSQGQAVNGQLLFQGPNSGNAFSYGPALTSLEFDGMANMYDTNGNLVPLENGNGTLANAYNNQILQTVFNSKHHVFFNVSQGVNKYHFHANHNSGKDIFNRERISDQKLTLSFDREAYVTQPGWNAFVKLSDGLYHRQRCRVIFQRLSKCILESFHWEE